MIRLSDIDTKRFGVAAARAVDVTVPDLSKIEDFCRVNEVKFLIARCSAGNVAAAQAMEESGYRLMDTLLYFTFDFSKKSLPSPAVSDYPVREAGADDALAIQEIARQGFQGYCGHYHADPQLDPATCDDVYADWAYNSCLSKDVADQVLVAESPAGVAGFITLKYDGELCLSAIAPAFLKQGIYRSLVIRALHCLKEKSRRALAQTQINNVAVQKVCIGLGFEPHDAVYTFHKWY